MTKHTLASRADRSLLVVVLLAAGCLFEPTARANPAGATVSQGAASFTTKGSQLTIQTSDRALINWQSFNIGVGQTTTFLQPSSSSVVWNQINDPNPSQILGNLNANGLVILQNQSGFFIGGQASITAHNLIMTTGHIPVPDLSSGGPWQFDTPPPAAKIINYGQLNLDKGGSVFLIANDIENHGAISAPEGNIGLYAGKQVLVSERPDGLGLSAQVTLPQGSVDNSGKLIADAGTIAVQAQVVNQGGLVQANSIREVNGVIELVASDSLNLGPSSVISAQGDTQGTSAGGSVTLKSGNSYQDSPTSVIAVSGGAQGGNAGQVEISAPQMSSIQSEINGQAFAGYAGGSLLIDPQNLMLVGGGTGAANVNQGDPPTPGTLTLAVGSFSSFASVTLQASQNIEVATPWILGNQGGSLVLQAGGNLTIDNNAAIVAGTSVNDLAANGWNLTLTAGADFNSATSVNHSGNGSIILTGNAYVQTTDGNINLNASDNITVGSGNSFTGAGAVRTVDGGSITASALVGSVDASGSARGGYSYTKASPGYFTVGGGASISLLGGISTYAGGDVTISAGQDVKSYLPTGTVIADPGIGAFGQQPGVVSITAINGNVYGNYVVTDSARNGQIVPSTITAMNGNAGVNAGDPTTLLALSLVHGGWQVSAPNGNIALQEVINANGTFNSLNSTKAQKNPYRFLFDYDPLSYVNLAAGIGVELVGGSAIPRVSGNAVPIIYPPTLSINAGSGGVQLDSDLILFPSPDGELNITTTGQGSFRSGPNGYHYLVMSDSGSQQWGTGAFTYPQGSESGDYALVPVQLNNPQPVVLNISGDMTQVGLTTPKETQITVHGNMTDVQFFGQNLHLGDVTSITVDGAIVEPAADDSLASYTAGFVLGGPGQFNITAASLDLGGSPNGITTLGPAKNPALDAFSGASIDLTIAGDITMSSSTIQTALGGDITVTAGGSINVGTSSDIDLGNGARGILTFTTGNIDITAAETIDVAGSRVAALNGGSITLESLQGDVNAGAGDQGDFTVTIYSINPNGSYQASERIYSGSGILSLTSPLQFGGSPFTLPGDVTITTPQGSIFAERGGIIQEPLNGNLSPGPAVTLTAGTLGPDGKTVVYVGNIDVTGAGVVGGKVDLTATGNITGLVIGRQDTTVNASQNFNGTLVTGGVGSVSAGGSVSGTIIALGGINVSGGGGVTATLLAQNVNGGQGGLASTTTASSASQAAAGEATAQAQEQTSLASSSPNDDPFKKKGKGPLLSRRVSRVTVILPKG